MMATLFTRSPRLPIADSCVAAAAAPTSARPKLGERIAKKPTTDTRRLRRRFSSEGDAASPGQ